MSLDSKYNRIKESNKLLTNFNALKPKNQKTLLEKERIMKNNDELYKKNYDVYKNDDDIDDKLNEVKKKKFDYRQFELFHKTDKKSKLDKETKKFLRRLKIEKRVLIKRN